MIKILVNSLPEKPEDCPFAINERYSKAYANCQLKCNSYAASDLYDHFSYGSNGITCSLHANKECPYLQVLYGSASW